MFDDPDEEFTESSRWFNRNTPRFIEPIARPKREDKRCRRNDTETIGVTPESMVF